MYNYVYLCITNKENNTTKFKIMTTFQQILAEAEAERKMIANAAAKRKFQRDTDRLITVKRGLSISQRRNK